VLFPANLKKLEWVQFPAAGFSCPVSGVIYSADRPPCCGVPLGGLGTGCLDLDARGVFGFSSIFNPGSVHAHHGNWRIPRKLPVLQPILGLGAGGKTWVLSAPEMVAGGEIPWCTDPQMTEPRGEEPPATSIPLSRIEDIEAARNIRYWGHFPVADMEFGTDAPVSAGMRAWTPFIPGDAAASNIPAAVFEVHLRNPSDQVQEGTLVFNFPGPDREEARAGECTRQTLAEDFSGLLVRSPGDVSYVLGTIGDEGVRFGGGLGRSGAAWAAIAGQLPQPAFREEQGSKLYQDASASAAVDFSLEPGQEKVVRFLLAWHAPVVEGARKTWAGEDRVEDGILRQRWLGSRRAGDTHYYVHMYAARYGSAVDVARRMVADHQTLLARVLAWQEAVYADQRYPIWLRDSLVNNLALIAEDSYWFQPRPPLGDQGHPGGVFALNESPRGCPHMSCNPCDWYGNLPIVFFFPELSLSNLRLYKQYQLETGEAPFALGKIGDLPDMATPEYYWQVSLNGACYVDMVDRQWQRTGDDAVLAEFYDSVKKCTTDCRRCSGRRGPGPLWKPSGAVTSP